MTNVLTSAPARVPLPALLLHVPWLDLHTARAAHLQRCASMGGGDGSGDGGLSAAIERKGKHVSLAELGVRSVFMVSSASFFRV
jgi:hypothetical protein